MSGPTFVRLDPGTDDDVSDGPTEGVRYCGTFALRCVQDYEKDHLGLYAPVGHGKDSGRLTRWLTNFLEVLNDHEDDAGRRARVRCLLQDCDGLSDNSRYHLVYNILRLGSGVSRDQIIGRVQSTDIERAMFEFVQEHRDQSIGSIRTPPGQFSSTRRCRSRSPMSRWRTAAALRNRPPSPSAGWGDEYTSMTAVELAKNPTLVYVVIRDGEVTKPSTMDEFKSARVKDGKWADKSGIFDDSGKADDFIYAHTKGKEIKGAF